MLVELHSPRQIAGEPERRWFTSRDMDLVVWQDAAGQPVGFQLCYDKRHQEKALTWRGEGTLSYAVVDAGDTHDMKHKASPVLLQGRTADLSALAESFRGEAGVLPPDIAALVLQVLAPPA